MTELAGVLAVVFAYGVALSAYAGYVLGVRTVRKALFKLQAEGKVALVINHKGAWRRIG